MADLKTDTPAVGLIPEFLHGQEPALAENVIEVE
jgi:hypothetical protein